jgi:hypothetical protein
VKVALKSPYGELDTDEALAHVRRVCLVWELWRVPVNGIAFFVLLWSWGIEPWFSYGGEMFVFFLVLNLYISLGGLAEIYAFGLLGWRWGRFRYGVMVVQVVLLLALARVTL